MLLLEGWQQETGHIRIRRAHTIYPHTLYISDQPGPGPGWLRGGPDGTKLTSAANRLIGEVVQSRRRPLLGPSPG